MRAPGTVTEVVYAGPVTRYVVLLDAGTSLIALQQNGAGAQTVAFDRGTAVDLLWQPEHVIAVPARPVTPTLQPRANPARQSPRTPEGAPRAKDNTNQARRRRSSGRPCPRGLRSAPLAGRRRGQRGPGGFKVPDLKPLDKLGTPEGEVSVLAWPGYVEDGSNDPKVDWVSDFEKSSGCKSRSRPSAPRTRPCS